MFAKSRISLFAIAAIGALGGCSHAADSADTQTSALNANGQSAAKPVASADSGTAAEHPGHGPRGGGPHLLFNIALHDAGLSDTQTKTLTTTLDSLEADGHAVREKERALFVAIAKAVSVSNVDEAALNPGIDALATAISVHAQQEKQALQTLHDTLSSAQRQLVVAKASERESKHRDREHHADFGDGGAPRGPHGFGHPGPGHMGFGPPGPSLGFLVHQLDLKPEQRKALHESFAKGDGGKPTQDAWHERAEEFLAKKKAFLTAFASDQFDANAQFDSSDLVAHVQKRWAHEIAFAKALVPVLTAEQKAKLAALADKPPAPSPPPGAAPPEP